jgi:hypothetical protein
LIPSRADALGTSRVQLDEKKPWHIKASSQLHHAEALWRYGLQVLPGAPVVLKGVLDVCHPASVAVACRRVFCKAQPPLAVRPHAQRPGRKGTGSQGRAADRGVGPTMVVLVQPGRQGLWAGYSLRNIRAKAHPSASVRWKRSILPLVCGR